MIKIDQRIKGKDVLLTLQRKSDSLEFDVRRAWFKSGKDLIKSANKAILKKPRFGRVYIIRGPSGRRRRHVASLPGESHANLSGALRKSINWKVKGRDLEFGYGVVKPTTSYAQFVEEGTDKMEARPSLRNAVNANSRNIEQHFKSVILKK